MANQLLTGNFGKPRVASDFGLNSLWIKRGLAAGLVAATAALITACGGGGAAAASNAPEAPVTVLPSTANVYPNEAATFTMSGGKLPYIVVSQNTAVVPNPTVVGSTFTLRPNNVTSDITVVIEVRDSSVPIKTTTVPATVRASTVDNSITITNSSGSCGSAQLCSGSDAIATVRSIVNGVAQVNRAIRFEAFQGEFGFVAPGGGSTMPSITATTNAQGQASVLIRASPTAQPQPAIVQVVDPASGLVRRFVFSIGLSNDGNSNITVIPTSQVWTNPYNDACVANAISSHYLYGGTPPYVITATNPQFATFGPSTVFTSGGAVQVSVTGSICGVDSQFIVLDSVGRRTTFQISNNRGALPPPAVGGGQIGAPTVAPATLGPLGCGVSASAFVNQVLPTGFTGPPPVLIATSLDPTRLSVTLSNGILTVLRLTTGGGGLDTLLVRVNNGREFVDVNVSLSGTAPYGCASTGGATNPITTTSSSFISLTNGNGIPVTITGGTPPYTVTTTAATVVQVSNDGTDYVTPGWSNIFDTGSPPAIVAEQGKLCISPTFPATGLPVIPPTPPPIGPPDNRVTAIGPGADGNTCYIFVPKDSTQITNQFVVRALRRNAVGQSGFVVITDSASPRNVQLIVVNVQ